MKTEKNNQFGLETKQKDKSKALAFGILYAKLISTPQEGDNSVQEGP